MEARYHSLLARAERTFADQPLTEVVGKTKAIIGVMRLPAGEKDAQAALDKLRAGEEPSPSELAALEFMIRLMRPAPLSRGGTLDDLPKQNQYNAGLVNAWQGFRKLVQQHLYAVGRLDQADGHRVGTGFLVDKELLVTNRHVLDALSFGAGELEKGQAVIRFRQEFDTNDPEAPNPVPILAKVAIHPTLDIALLRVPRQEGRAPLLLETAPAAVGRAVVAVGYPFQDAERNPIFVDPIFQGNYGVKRAAPGEIIQADAPNLYHDCSTLGGNSGSPLLALDTARVVGLHRAGFFMYRNEAVDGPSLAAFLKPYLT